MEDALDVQYLLGVLKRRWPYFLIPTTILSAAAVAVAMTLPPVYVSTGRILVQSQQIPEEFVRSSVTAVAAERIQLIQQRVLTRANLLEVARKFDLIDPDAGASPTGTVGYLREGTTIEPVQIRGGQRGAIAFDISFESSDPTLAARIANELITLILNEDVRTRAARASDTTEFLEREARRLEQEVTGIEGEIAAYKDENRNALPDRLPFLLSTLDGLRDRRARIEAEIRRTAEETRFARLQLDAALANPGTTAAPADPLAAELLRLKTEFREIELIYSEAHPRRRMLKSRIQAVESELEERKVDTATALDGEGETATDAVPVGVTPELVVLQERQRALDEDLLAIDEQIAVINEVVALVPQVELGLAVLTRRIDTTKGKLAEVWRKHADAKLAERLEQNKKSERFEVIEPPTEPTQPVKPNRMRILAIGLFLAFGGGGAGMVLVEIMDNSIRRPNDLVSKLGIRPLVVVPYLVSREEISARRRRTLLTVVTMMVLVGGALAAVHYFHTPLDLLIPKVTDRF